MSKLFFERPSNSYILRNNGEPSEFINNVRINRFTKGCDLSSLRASLIPSISGYIHPVRPFHLQIDVQPMVRFIIPAGTNQRSFSSVYPLSTYAWAIPFSYCNSSPNRLFFRNPRNHYLEHLQQPIG